MKSTIYGYTHEWKSGPRARPEAIRRVACPARLMRATIERIDTAARKAGMTRTRFIERAILDALEVSEFNSLSGLCITQSSQQ